MNLLATDLLALCIVGLAAWKVVRVAHARLRPRAGVDGKTCGGCHRCPGNLPRR